MIFIIASSSNALGQWSPETGPPFVKHLTMWSDPKCVDHTGVSAHARDSLITDVVPLISSRVRTRSCEEPVLFTTMTHTSPCRRIANARATTPSP
jgi:hypothetical protein